MKIKLLLITIVFMTIITSCSNKELSNNNAFKTNKENQVNVQMKENENQNIVQFPSDTVVEFEQVENLINQYERRIVEAINNKDFSLVEPYLVAESPLYKSQKQLVEDLYSKGIREEYVSHDFVHTYFVLDNIYKVEVIETIKIKYPKNDAVEKEFHWIYTANKVEKSMQLSQIENWVNFDKDIEKLENSVKADGYYVDELSYSQFDSALINKLNNNSNELDSLFGNEEAKKKQFDLLEELRGKGNSYSIINSELAENSDGEVQSSPFDIVKTLRLSYIDKNSNKVELTLKLTLIIEEYRTGYHGLMDGYAMITDVRNIVIE